MVRSYGKGRRNLDTRSIYPWRGAEATKNRAGDRWRARKAADLQDRSALHLLILRMNGAPGRQHGNLFEDYASNVLNEARSLDYSRIVFRGMATLVSETESVFESGSLVLVEHADAFSS